MDASMRSSCACSSRPSVCLSLTSKLRLSARAWSSSCRSPSCSFCIAATCFSTLAVSSSYFFAWVFACFSSFEAAADRSSICRCISSLLDLISSSCCSSLTTSAASAVDRELSSCMAWRAASRSSLIASSARAWASSSASYCCIFLCKLSTTLAWALYWAARASFSSDNDSASLFCCARPRCRTSFSSVSSSMCCCSMLN
mmetsp:Transcript_9871/g.21062  ORF Transcript_9871/g.21062 Transcript_9871/m.21062 type:complete len:200 (-) Transcript_9871:37-636(-)